ncbi:MAG: hypothetical protein ACQETL_00815 [Bacteroidota bacterium]
MKIYQKMSCNLTYLHWRKSNLLIISLVFLFACSSGNKRDENTKEDAYQINFRKFIEKHNQYYEKYVVLDYGRCHYCDNKVKQALLNMDCLTAREGIAFILYSQKRLPDELEILLDNKNMFHYNDVNKPIMMDFPRVYSVAKSKNDQIKINFNWYDAQSFANELESLCARRVSEVYISTFRTKSKGIPIAGSPDFMILSEENGYSYEEVEGVSNAYLLQKNKFNLP